MDGVTRAAYRWRGGEGYQLIPFTNAPLWWVNCTPEEAPRARVSSKSATAPSPRSAERRLSPVYVPGEPLNVTIETAPGDAQGWAVEEQVPTGWTISQISHEGAFNASHATVRWGPFTDGMPRTFTYRIVPPLNAVGSVVFSGMVSFDGISLPIAGGSQSAAAVRLLHLVMLGEAQFVLRLKGFNGDRCWIEASSDLNEWELLGEAAIEQSQVQFHDPQAQSGGQRFYRLRWAP